MNEIIKAETIAEKIYEIRGMHIMLDRDLAKLYEVETKTLNQAVKRNKERFPQTFMFQLTDREFSDWRSQIVTSNADKMGLRRPPYAFTEQGVAMLSSVLRSKTAHDRFLILDEKDVYHLGASLKDLGKKWFAFSKIDKDALKVVEKLGERRC